GPDRPLAVTTSSDGSAIIWDLYEGKELYCYQLPYAGGPVTVVEAGFVIAYEAEVAYFEWPIDVFSA
ncbi:hypothetical protein, partial [Streptomyces sp. NPDC002692]